MKTGYDVQDKMYYWFLRRSEKYKYSVSIQDVTKTNALLKEAGITYEDLDATDIAMIAKKLGVDGLIQTRIRSDRPMSDGVAVALTVLVGFYGSTNNVETSINIKDGNTGDLLWKYDYNASGSVGSSTTKLIDHLMRNASKKFPYSEK